MTNLLLQRYIWLLNTINDREFITLSEISQAWQKSRLNETRGPLPERTFHYHRDAIKYIFNIEIKYRKGKGYYVDSLEESMDAMGEWLMTSLSISNTITESANLNSRISFPNVPSGRKYLSKIISAMKDNRMIEIEYHPFDADSSSVVTIAPYCVKAFKQRWYVITEGEENIAVAYALDRIRSLRILSDVFALPEGFDASDMFRGHFGIVMEKESPPQVVVLKVWGKQRDYFKTLPLSDDMTEIEAHDEWSIFTCTLAPTWDLEMELLQYNDNVEVISPVCLRDMMIEHAWNMLHLYGEL